MSGNSDFFGPAQDWLVDITRGLIPGQRLVSTFGHNNAVGATAEDIWPAGGIYNWLDAATLMTLSSTSAADTALGAGARTVRVYGLDANYTEIEETVTLAGTTPVSTVNSYLRVHELRVLSAGTNQSYNVGEVYIGTGTVTAGVPAVVHLMMDIGENRAKALRYTIPAGYTGYVLEHDFSVVGNNVAAECYIFSRFFGGVFFVRRRFMVVTNNYQFRGHAVLPEKSDIVGRAAVSQGSTDIASNMALLLVKN